MKIMLIFHLQVKTLPNLVDTQFENLISILTLRARNFLWLNICIINGLILNFSNVNHKKLILKAGIFPRQDSKSNVISGHLILVSYSTLSLIKMDVSLVPE